MLAGVGQGFLGRAVDGQASLGREPARGTAHLVADLTSPAIVGGESGQRLGQIDRVGPQGRDGLPGFLQALDGQPAGAPDQAAARFGIIALAQQGVGSVELDHQAAQGVGQDVVDLPGDARPFVQHLRPDVFLLGPLRLDGGQLGILGSQPVLAAP